MKNAMFMIIIYNDWKNDVNNKSFSSFYKEQADTISNLHKKMTYQEIIDMYEKEENQFLFYKYETSNK